MIFLFKNDYILIVISFLSNISFVLFFLFDVISFARRIFKIKSFYFWLNQYCQSYDYKYFLFDDSFKVHFFDLDNKSKSSNLFIYYFSFENNLKVFINQFIIIFRNNHKFILYSNEKYTYLCFFFLLLIKEKIIIF